MTNRTVLLALFILPLLSACQFLAGTAAVGAGSVAVEERTTGRFIDDTTIYTKIEHLLFQKHVDDLFRAVDVDVHEGRVLLTGQVKDEATMIEAVRLAWQVQGVKEVINEIQISDSTFKRSAQDSFITANLRGRLLATKGISSTNYSVETVNGVVYLLGIAQSEQELHAVTTIASRIKGVNKVVSHVRMKDSPLREGN